MKISVNPFMHVINENEWELTSPLSIRAERLPIAAALFFALPVGEMTI